MLGEKLNISSNCSEKFLHLENAIVMYRKTLMKMLEINVLQLKQFTFWIVSFNKLRIIFGHNLHRFHDACFWLIIITFLLKSKKLFIVKMLWVSKHLLILFCYIESNKCIITSTLRSRCPELIKELNLSRLLDVSNVVFSHLERFMRKVFQYFSNLRVFF